MKKLVALGMVSLVAITFSVTASAACWTKCHYGYWGQKRCKTVCRTDYPSYPHHHHSHHQVHMNCAPEVVSGNLAATERVLSDLIARPEFASEEKFKSEVVRIAKINDDKRKVSEFFKMVDVSTSEDIAHFIGAREEEYSKYTDSLIDNTDLSKDNAERVVESLVTSLKGNLK